MPPIGIPKITLNDGLQVPVLAFGTGSATYQKSCKDVTRRAYEKAQMRHFDCAEWYKNEGDVGTVLKALGVRREEVFITTKCGDHPVGSTDPRESLKRSLQLLGVSYVDLYLIHSPEFVQDVGISKAWSIMEALRKEGMTTSIGVSNFRMSDIEELMKFATVIPSVNQIEVHPYVYGEVKPSIKLCQTNGITVEGYGSLASLFRYPGGPADNVVSDIARELGANEGQVLLKWAHQVTHRGPIVTTSSKAERLKEHIKAFTEMRDLSDAQIKAIEEAGNKSPQSLRRDTIFNDR